MAQPLDKAQFDALMARAGLDLTEADKEGIRAASAHTQAAAARVRTPREVSVESATIFTLKGASA
jgi:NOL1/NOP2/fmu family ribosome biogenesis protein